MCWWFCLVTRCPTKASDALIWSRFPSFNNIFFCCICELELLEALVSQPSLVAPHRHGQIFLSQERTSLLMPAEIAEAIFIPMPTLALFFSLLSRLHLSPCSKLPSWARAVVPKIFYVTEKAWNYYPYTITGKRTEFICRSVRSASVSNVRNRSGASALWTTTHPLHLISSCGKVDPPRY